MGLFPTVGYKMFFYHRGGTSFPILVFLMGSVSKCQSRRSSLNQLVMFVKGFFGGILAGLELVDHDNNIIKIIIVIMIIIIIFIQYYTWQLFQIYRGDIFRSFYPGSARIFYRSRIVSEDV